MRLLLIQRCTFLKFAFNIFLVKSQKLHFSYLGYISVEFGWLGEHFLLLFQPLTKIHLLESVPWFPCLTTNPLAFGLNIFCAQWSTLEQVKEPGYLWMNRGSKPFHLHMSRRQSPLNSQNIAALTCRTWKLKCLNNYWS